ncbi:hypothetical protein B0H17DRAFT_1146405 [Mycena rosella]|uniref:Uncharacterized protein n=1 Tax=Mycena rosella TaxID=1033263 RepID=A0AAD7CNX9_MYCRO|nr:hypothetical protein B0H17DRAFT_1146405 [Mycena rosella]
MPRIRLIYPFPRVYGTRCTPPHPNGSTPAPDALPKVAGPAYTVRTHASPAFSQTGRARSLHSNDNDRRLENADARDICFLHTLWEGRCHIRVYSTSSAACSGFAYPPPRLLTLEMALALTFVSFGDIIEIARLAKRIIDALRSGRASYKRQKVIPALKHLLSSSSVAKLGQKSVAERRNNPQLNGGTYGTRRRWARSRFCISIDKMQLIWTKSQAEYKEHIIADPSRYRTYMSIPEHI